jgi:ribosome-binding protein aMBF1 (putative translation factor)
MIFDHLKFANVAKRIHVKPNEILTYESIPDSEVRKKLEKFIGYGKNPRSGRNLRKSRR